MGRKQRWGVLGVAGIAVNKVIPAMQKCEHAEITAIASRDAAKAAGAAAALGIGKHYGSYEALLADGEIDVIYNPLPNHLHVPWSKRALEAGKHVLCEKPLALSTAEVRCLMEVRDRTGLQAGEAFMVATHPQWLRAREIVRSGQIGELRAVSVVFSYFNRDPENVRNVPEYGGGGLMDIGCYAIFGSRFLFGAEPLRAAGVLELDPDFGTDRLASAALEFPNGQANFVCSMQMVPSQRVVALGTLGRIEIEIPFNAPPDAPCRLWVDDGSDLAGRSRVEETFAVCDQYTVQGDAFSRAVMGEGEVPVPLEDSLRTMAAIEAIVRSSASGRWEAVAA
ncbi:MAG: Gfo/Idh/MocA family oxidoreductase [Candidatus Solibacter usitatus]|nr:Gfo/Idh/MocA family oxidoreductase [Candidatus Solibacter usitatus]